MCHRNSLFELVYLVTSGSVDSPRLVVVLISVCVVNAAAVYFVSLCVFFVLLCSWGFDETWRSVSNRGGGGGGDRGAGRRGGRGILIFWRVYFILFDNIITSPPPSPHEPCLYVCLPCRRRSSKGARGASRTTSLTFGNCAAMPYRLLNWIFTRVTI